jgi:hypothetical protein
VLFVGCWAQTGPATPTTPAGLDGTTPTAQACLGRHVTQTPRQQSGRMLGIALHKTPTTSVRTLRNTPPICGHHQLQHGGGGGLSPWTVRTLQQLVCLAKHKPGSCKRSTYGTLTELAGDNNQLLGMWDALPTGQPACRAPPAPIQPSWGQPSWGQPPYSHHGASLLSHLLGFFLPALVASRSLMAFSGADSTLTL